MTTPLSYALYYNGTICQQKTKVKLWTHRFFADDHLLDLHHLCDVVRCGFEWCSSCPVVDANKNVSAHVVTTINTYQPTKTLNAQAHTHARTRTHTHLFNGPCPGQPR